ncbi:hypothetical protein BD779DRAFT_1718614 [Infundibulicybe gibba]|nr:hypothetical protein BD779DRAFT_1718614 [Infundibulicybe gibba]
MDQNPIPERVSGRQTQEPTGSRHQTPQRRVGHAMSPTRTSEGVTPGPSTVKRHTVKTEPLQDELIRAQKQSHERSISREGYDTLGTTDEEEVEDRMMEIVMRERGMLDRPGIRNDNNCSKAIKMAHNLTRHDHGITYERDDFTWTEEYVETYFEHLRRACEILVEKKEERRQSRQTSRIPS